MLVTSPTHLVLRSAAQRWGRPVALALLMTGQPALAAAAYLAARNAEIPHI